jgi:DNA-binding transcriptional regulator/RsmH inhibitor MraZ
MEMPVGILDASVDDKGRLKLPLSFHAWMAAQKVWFLSLHDDGKSLQLRSTGENDQKVEIDPTGRVQISTAFLTDFKGEHVRVICRKDCFVVMTAKEFGRVMQSCGL